MEKFATTMFATGSFIVGSMAFFKFFTYTVDGGQKGLIFDRLRGLREKLYGEGMHLYIPII